MSCIAMQRWSAMPSRSAVQAGRHRSSSLIMAGIFICYRQEDSKPWALLLCRELADVFGEDRIFLDKDTLQAGNWREQIHDALNQCPAVLVLMGRKWLTITDPAGGRRLDRPDDVHRQEV